MATAAAAEKPIAWWKEPTRDFDPEAAARIVGG